MVTATPAPQPPLETTARIRTDPFPNRGHIGAEEKAAVEAFLNRVLADGLLPAYDGEEERAYCTEFAAYLGGGYADAVSSGSAAVYVALKALQLEPFSEVIVGAFTDPGGMMPIPLLNLIPMIADAVPDSYNTGPAQVAALISPRTSAIVVPHIAGDPADIVGVMAVARQHGLPVIEDCAQAHGARVNGQLVGTFGDLMAMSTMGGKHHSTGPQGGVVFTKEEALYHEVRRASDRGKPFFLPPGSTNVTASLNFNLNDLAATIGRVQLRKLPESIRRRQAIAAQLREGLADLPAVTMQPPQPGVESSHWFLPLKFHADQARSTKVDFCAALRAEGLTVQTDYRGGLPHTHDWFVNRRVFGTSGYPWASPDYHGDPDQHFPCPNAHAMLESHFNLLFHENWSSCEVDDAIAIFHNVSIRKFPVPAGSRPNFRIETK
ncbi:MAG TPA: DegT/DnrJ/EryC1/StrS family aminotransferase [Caldilineaceae bacterium]|nr:DegT/DnrJ/EryC1/StrS family aminotransferase [Caldilineaceae bacterium]